MRSAQSAPARGAAGASRQSGYPPRDETGVDMKGGTETRKLPAPCSLISLPYHFHRHRRRQRHVDHQVRAAEPDRLEGEDDGRALRLDGDQVEQALGSRVVRLAQLTQARGERRGGRRVAVAVPRPECQAEGDAEVDQDAASVHALVFALEYQLERDPRLHLERVLPAQRIDEGGNECVPGLYDELDFNGHLADGIGEGAVLV